jgi:hypothetical protein
LAGRFTKTGLIESDRHAIVLAVEDGIQEMNCQHPSLWGQVLGVTSQLTVQRLFKATYQIMLHPDRKIQLALQWVQNQIHLIHQ